MISIVRWARDERVLPGTEVDDEFVAFPDIIHLFGFTTDRMSVGEHAGMLSLKLVTHGLERFQIGRRSVAIRPGQVLWVNEGQAYSSSIDEPRTRSISFFLPTAVALDALQAARDFDQAPRTGGPDILQVPFRASPMVSTGVNRLSEAMARPGELERDHLHELLLQLATGALGQATGIGDATGLQDCVHRATREELVTRVLRARDLICDTHGRTTLNQMAFEAGLRFPVWGASLDGGWRFEYSRVQLSTSSMDPRMLARPTAR